MVGGAPTAAGESVGERGGFGRRGKRGGRGRGREGGQGRGRQGDAAEQRRRQGTPRHVHVHKRTISCPASLPDPAPNQPSHSLGPRKLGHSQICCWLAPSSPCVPPPPPPCGTTGRSAPPPPPPAALSARRVPLLPPPPLACVPSRSLLCAACTALRFPSQNSGHPPVEYSGHSPWMVKAELQATRGGEGRGMLMWIVRGAGCWGAASLGSMTNSSLAGKVQDTASKPLRAPAAAPTWAGRCTPLGGRRWGCTSARTQTGRTQGPPPVAEQWRRAQEEGHGCKAARQPCRQGAADTPHNLRAPPQRGALLALTSRPPLCRRSTQHARRGTARSRASGAPARPAHLRDGRQRRTGGPRGQQRQQECHMYHEGGASVPEAAGEQFRSYLCGRLPASRMRSSTPRSLARPHLSLSCNTMSVHVAVLPPSARGACSARRRRRTWSRLRAAAVAHEEAPSAKQPQQLELVADVPVRLCRLPLNGGEGPCFALVVPDIDAGGMSEGTAAGSKLGSRWHQPERCSGAPTHVHACRCHCASSPPLLGNRASSAASPVHHRLRCRSDGALHRGRADRSRPLLV